VLIDGRVTSFSERFSSGLLGIGNAEGTWLRLPTRNCWTRSGSADTVKNFGFGQPPIPTHDVSYSSVHRAGDTLSVTTTQHEAGSTISQTFEVDAETKLIRSTRHRVSGAYPLSETTARHASTPSSEAPISIVPEPAC
jgi:hypothetical protein